jgi:hypothetical protein
LIFFLSLVAIVLIVAALRDTQGDLFAAIREDITAFGIWGGALIALGLLGFIPGIKPVSRALLALVLVVLFVNNYQSILDGFSKAWSGESE